MLMQSYPVLSWHILTQTKRPALHMRWRPEARAGGTPDQPCSCFSTTLVCSSAWRNLRSANVKSQKARLDLDIYIYIYIHKRIIHDSIYNICRISKFVQVSIHRLICLCFAALLQPRRPEPKDRQSLYLPRISNGMEDLDGVANIASVSPVSPRCIAFKTENP